MRRAALLVALAACAPQGATPPVAQGLALDAGGIQPAGTPLRIDFGRAESGAVAAVSRLLGADPVERVTNADCGAGPVTAVRWANGLTMNFQRGAFLGWASAPGPAAPGTTAGLRPGSPRSALEAVPGVRLRQTSLGTEFDLGGISGLVEGERLGTLWAGTTCIFR